ncbi:MAG: ATP-dependent DNA helicase RecG [Pseudomonadota bacterium]
MPVNALQSPVTTLKGVGPALAEKLARLDVVRVEDLLFLMPIRYEDRTRITPLGSLQPGQRCLVQGEILLTEVAFRGRRTLFVKIGDGTGTLTLRFFYFTNAQRDRFRNGRWLSCFGDVRRSRGGLEIVHPEYRDVGTQAEKAEGDALTPIYPTTDGVNQGRLRALTQRALNLLQANTPLEVLPASTRDKLRLPTLTSALSLIHAPPADAATAALAEGSHPAQQRLALEELLAQYLSLRALRQRIQSEPAPVLDAGTGLQQDFLAALPFSLTGAQARVLGDLNHDMNQPAAMLRLVQGDVGSGKTVVAAAAALNAIAAGFQCALMAPTELLAEQHLTSFDQWFSALGIRTTWLSGSLKAANRRQALADIESGQGQMVIGTHALFQEGVVFHRLGLVIIDEQHRFGVHQRLALREKGSEVDGVPHQLVMTATPIPRTLAMTAYADLDTSVIDELPPGRTPVSTVVIPETRRDEVIARVLSACEEGQQAYWVCPLVEASDVLDYQAAEDTHAALSEALPSLAVGLVHGRMKAVEKERVMAQFKRGELQVLVATTVIEVGVDVPNASLMIIENAERMGLSQLHQLRGRVGRGARASSCVLLYKAPLSKMAKARLAVLRDSTDGFVIAQRDLELRGPGEVLGTRQTGSINLRIADLSRDGHLLPEVQTVANALLSDDSPQGALRVQTAIDRWIGNASRYGNV